MRVDHEVPVLSSLGIIHRWWHGLERGWQATILGLALCLVTIALV